jgi:hypothetical protein
MDALGKGGNAAKSGSSRLLFADLPDTPRPPQVALLLDLFRCRVIWTGWVEINIRSVWSARTVSSRFSAQNSENYIPITVFDRSCRRSVAKSVMWAIQPRDLPIRKNVIEIHFYFRVNHGFQLDRVGYKSIAH